MLVQQSTQVANPSLGQFRMQLERSVPEHSPSGDGDGAPPPQGSFSEVLSLQQHLYPREPSSLAGPSEPADCQGQDQDEVQSHAEDEQ